MNSKWIHLKSIAISLRQEGESLRSINRQLLIPKSTLSGWFKDLVLDLKAQILLDQQWKDGLIKARARAVLWHNKQKENRINDAEIAAKATLDILDVSSLQVLEISLAMLYLGEGFKTESGYGLGNSSAEIMKFFVTTSNILYGLNFQETNPELHLRADQNSTEEINYWSNELNIPKEKFNKVYFDKRTVGKKTYPNYHGVCSVRYGNIAIQRRLISLANQFCKRTVSSAGRASH